MSCLRTVFIFITLCFVTAPSVAQIGPVSSFEDLTHESKVFGRPKSYRLYLPTGYRDSGKNYPVIYFFHGWGGRHFKDDNAKLDYVKLKGLVDKYHFIMVMWDGSIDEAEPRPYNVGYHEDVKFQVQMKDYFPELVSYIDTTYRTIADRSHRGVIGFSMGGFMALYLAGKYPDRVSAAVSMTGSPEFFVGTPKNHTLYPFRYTFANLRNVDVRMHTSSTDILYYLNEEVYRGSLREGMQISYENFPGGHMVDKAGETVVFEKAVKFVMDAFKKEHPTPASWSHYDTDHDFALWGYHLESNKKQPGFIFLKNVTKKGFGIYTHQWLPGGPPVPMDTVHITTPAIYRPFWNYDVATYSRRTGEVILTKVKSDLKGSLQIKADPQGSETGIVNTTDPAEWVLVDHQVNGGSQYLSGNGNSKLELELFNRGGNKSATKPVKVILSSSEKGIIIRDSVVLFRPYPDQRTKKLPSFEVSCFKNPPFNGDDPAVKFRITVYADQDKYSEEFTVPVNYEVPFFSGLKMDDGVVVRDRVFGKGNGDGLVNPGEKIMIYNGNNRLRLYTEDPWVQSDLEQLADEIIPARWPDGYTQSSVIQISPGCPDGHEIECLASYEIKTFNPIERKVVWGKVKLQVRSYR